MSVFRIEYIFKIGHSIPLINKLGETDTGCSQLFVFDTFGVTNKHGQQH